MRIARTVSERPPAELALMELGKLISRGLNMDDHDECSRRHAVGVKPVSFLKATPKAL